MLDTRLENGCSVIQVPKAFLQLVLHTLHWLLLEVSLVHHMNIYMRIPMRFPWSWHLGFLISEMEHLYIIIFTGIMDHHPLLSEGWIYGNYENDIISLETFPSNEPNYISNSSFQRGAGDCWGKDLFKSGGGEPASSRIVFSNACLPWQRALDADRMKMTSD